MTVKDRITERLAALRPLRMDILDESHLHAGHSGARPGGETHFRVRIVSDAFAGKSRVERHRIVNGLLAAELQGPVHALAIDARTPDEAGR